jgi:hypothetical protein
MKRKRLEVRGEGLGSSETVDLWLPVPHLLLLTSYFLLLALNVHAADEIRDVKPPVTVPGSPWWHWLWIVVLAGLAWILFMYWKKYRLKFQKPPVVKTAWEMAYERLADLERQNLFAQGKVKDYFSALSDITRRYIEDRFNVHAPEMTTEEFLNSVKANPFIADQQKEILKKFLVLSDMVKFAKYGPTAGEAKESFDLAKRFVDETLVRDTGMQDQQYRDRKQKTDP